MSDKAEGVGGRSVPRRVACPGPFQTQPADTSPGPQNAAGSVSALADDAVRVGTRIHEAIELAVMALEAPYGGYGARPLTYEDVAREIYKPMPVSTYRCGLLFRWGSAWIGAHWSAHNKRLCLNVIPFVTFWITAPGGYTP